MVNRGAQPNMPRGEMTPPPIENYFVCIGAQKSGTTWLGRVLQDHPDVFVTPVKEIHYFDHIAGITQHLGNGKRRSRYRKYHQRMWTQWGSFKAHRSQWAWYRDYMSSPIDDAWYARLFQHRGGKRMAGELTPEYAILGRAGLAHIARLAPDARVIFIMRNPVARTWSQVLHQCRSRGLDVARLSTEDIVAMIAEPRFGELGDYASTLDDMAATFPPDRILNLFYEEMHADRPAAIAQVCAYLGVAFDPAYFGELGRRFNRSQDAVLPDPVRAHLVAMMKPQAIAVRDRLGRIPQAWAREFGIAENP